MKIDGQYTADPNKILHIYTRISTVVQANEGISLDTQQRLGEAKAK